MASSLEEETIDLTTCCICLESYDLKEHKPKYLPCSHTFCQGCLKGINRDAGNNVTCPVCKKKVKLPVAEVEGLPNNIHAIHFVKVDNEKKAEQSWCLTCGAMVKQTCLEAQHQTRDLLEDAKECQTDLDEVLKGFEAGDAMRGRFDGVLQAKLKAIEAQIAKNNSGRQKIQSAMARCQKIAKLSLEMKLSPVIKKEVKQLKKKMKEELGQAKILIDCVAHPSPAQTTVEQPIAETQSVARRSVKRTATEAAAAVEEEDRNESSDHGQNLRGSRETFAAKCLFAVHQRKESDVTSLFNCRDLLGHTGYARAVEFSDDGALLASGGYDEIVRLWHISSQAQVERGQHPTVPIEMKTRQKSIVNSLAFTPDNQRLFSAGMSGKILIHDVQTKKLLNTLGTIDEMKYVVSISLQPGSGGNILATADLFDSALRIFDVRRSRSIPVFEEKNATGKYLMSAMFSPINSSLIAVAGTEGTHILDIRSNSCRRIHSLCSHTNTFSARFDARGSRLLCSPYSKLPVVYNVPNEQQKQPASNRVTDKVQLTANGYSVAKSEHSSSCFAGDNDELAVASSSDHRLFIWSVPEGQGDRTIDQCLLYFSGHQHSVNAVCYSKATSTLASGDEHGILKLWTPVSTT